MKKIYFMLAFFATAFTQNSFAEGITSNQPSLLRTSYYCLIESLVSSNATLSVSAAKEFIKDLKGISKVVINVQSFSALLRNVVAISQTNDLNVQREKFDTLSFNMIELAKAVKLSTEPIYQQYCLMKKASWPSNNRAIKKSLFLRCYAGLRQR